MKEIELQEALNFLTSYLEEGDNLDAYAQWLDEQPGFIQAGSGRRAANQHFEMLREAAEFVGEQALFETSD